jgi:hypothetical protein
MEKIFVGFLSYREVVVDFDDRRAICYGTRERANGVTQKKYPSPTRVMTEINNR